MITKYSVVYDKRSFGWNKECKVVKLFLYHQQAYVNDILRSRGHIFLNEVFDNLGMPRTRTGQIVGWVYNEEKPTGDNFVDFGLAEAFEDPESTSYQLTFNVDGDILYVLEEDEND